MPRLDPPSRPGLLARAAAAFARHRLGRVPKPLDLYAHSPAVVAGVSAYEASLERMRAAPPRLVALAELRAATRVGCPF
jgi:hypothetical protein